MSGVTTVDFKMFEPGRDGIGHGWRRIQEYLGVFRRRQRRASLCRPV
jgi:hypothetical protein